MIIRKINLRSLCLFVIASFLWAVPALSSGAGGAERANAPAAHSVVKPSPAKGVTVAQSQEVEKAPAPHAEEPEGMPPEEALKILMEGNERVVMGKVKSPNRSAQRRGELMQGQRPIVVIITCSDSRVPPELLFDVGYGDVFVIRTAGNVVDDVALGSIEYALDHLAVRLVVVLGHTRCGAVTAAVEGGELPGHLPAVVGLIDPAVEEAKAKPGELLPNAIKMNVRTVTRKIMHAVPGFIERAEESEIGIVGGVYDLETGKVKLTYRPML